MVFNCKSCGAALKEANINFATGIATCSHCQAVMSFAEDLKVSPPEAAEARKKARVGRPENLEIEETPVRLRFSRRWYTPGLFFLLFFCIAWDAFLIGWYAMGTQMPNMGIMGVVMLVFPIGHVAVGVGLTYSVLAGFLNRTTIDVTASELTVQHGPIPWKGNQRLSVSDITQLYCKGHDRGQQTAGGEPALYARLRDDRHVKLLGKTADLDTMLYLERRLEERLGIRDEAMPGEYAG